jgi:hypothetical protein
MYYEFQMNIFNVLLLCMINYSHNKEVVVLTYLSVTASLSLAEICRRMFVFLSQK